MTARLTQEEFLSRFRERSTPLLRALNSDIEQYRLKLKGRIKVQPNRDGNREDIDTGNLEIELVYKAMARLISLIYSDDPTST